MDAVDVIPRPPQGWVNAAHRGVSPSRATRRGASALQLLLALLSLVAVTALHGLLPEHDEQALLPIMTSVAVGAHLAAPATSVTGAVVATPDRQALTPESGGQPSSHGDADHCMGGRLAAGVNIWAPLTSSADVFTTAATTASVSATLDPPAMSGQTTLLQLCRLRT